MSQAVEFGPNGGPHSIGDAADLAQPILSWASTRFDRARKYLKQKRKGKFKTAGAAVAGRLTKGVTNVAARWQSTKFYAQNSGMRAGARAYRKYEDQAVKAADNRAKVQFFADRSRAQGMLLNQIAAGNGRRIAPGIQQRSAQRRRVSAQRAAARMGTRAVRAQRRALGFAAQAQPARDRAQVLHRSGQVPQRAREMFNL
ncbi:hypothetical protein ACIBSV_26970 [Embleya sp. NPDC050154]|uniref:hypothetical protein n=1 Tax=Embleya sp. NPDC050154 TaxID=3363988 RepID=UPI0037A087C3